MTGEPLPAHARANADLPLDYGRRHLERLGYRLLDQQYDRRSGDQLLIARSETRREVVFCELRAERLGEPAWPPGGMRRRRLRQAALGWLAANRTVQAHTLRFDLLTVLVGHDGLPVGLEHEPQAF